MQSGETHVTLRALHQMGWTVSQLAREFGLSRRHHSRSRLRGRGAAGSLRPGPGGARGDCARQHVARGGEGERRGPRGVLLPATTVTLTATRGHRCPRPLNSASRCPSPQPLGQELLDGRLHGRARPYPRAHGVVLQQCFLAARPRSHLTGPFTLRVAASAVCASEAA